MSLAMPILWWKPLIFFIITKASFCMGSVHEEWSGVEFYNRYRYYKHSEQARVPHTNGPRDLPRCGALSLLQKTLHYEGG
jgi:hypothetical protein